VGRKVMVRVLQRMASDRVIERNSGYGWRFASLLRSEESLAESFYFRLMIEPQALLAPGFKLDRTWLARSRKDHQMILATLYNDASMVRFFEINSNFHEKLAEMSGNPFIHHAVQLQNQIRRFVDVGGNYGYEKIREGCEEHLQILDALDRGDNQWASSLMRRHIELASRNKPIG
jgi:DNA-binding GntR family transcriptional regulator